MRRSIIAGPAVLLLLLALVLSGCVRHKPVRHLAADACLITPTKTTKKEVLSFLGEPDERHELAGGSEEWLYYQANKSLLRKTPYVGKNLGHEEYDVLHVVFTGDTATSCTYRALNEETFRQDEEGTPK